MMSLSLFARRSAMMASRRFHVAPNPISTLERTFSTETDAQVQAVEEMLMNLRWAYIKDNVEEIRQLLNETKTNHALREPGAGFEDQVANKMKEIQDMIATNPSPNRDEIQARVCGLKRMVKGELYA